MSLSAGEFIDKEVGDEESGPSMELGPWFGPGVLLSTACDDEDDEGVIRAVGVAPPPTAARAAAAAAAATAALLFFPALLLAFDLGECGDGGMLEFENWPS